MHRFISIALVSMAATQVLAHPSVVPHAHPHGVSALPELRALLAAVVVVGFAMLVAKILRKR